MALINCSECGKQISDKAESCPSCGMKLKNNKKGCSTPMLLVWIALFGVFLYIYFGLFSGNSSNDYDGIISDSKTYSYEWRSPKGTQFIEFGKIIVKNNIRVCGEYKVKEIKRNEFLIACTQDGNNWEYFVIYPNLDKIYKANDEMIRGIEAPR
ncbi:MAG: zinc-ribbon domain-containing protein [Lutibacter sp.]